jgi:transglutaminase-like putative cysteine protease
MARPTSFWLMSLVASASLWITDQLEPWVVAVQLLAYAVSLATHQRPPAFRRSPLWLNIGMIGITSVTIRSALAGNPATISLAYFAALAQGLQLLDARPKRSEFLLVALALFQVILASNLTDSVFFPPLLVIFLGCVTWSLILHTLGMEAASHGDATVVRHAVAPDLRRTTILASCACLVLASVLFIVLPRMKTQVLRGGMGPGLALSGFSSQVALGDIGRIRHDRSVVLRIESVDGELPEPEEAYWRGLAFDAFDGRHWSISAPTHRAARATVSGIGRFGVELLPDSERPHTTHRIVREPVAAGVLFSPAEVQRVTGPFQWIETDANGGLYLPGRGDERIRYTVRSRVPERSSRRLARDRSLPPNEAAMGGARAATRYLALPPLDPRVHQLANEIVEGADSDFERALRIQERLRVDGRYTDTPPPLGDSKRSPIEDFLLGEQAGHCEYFASAMVVLARSQGLPSRLVNGFAGGMPNRIGGFVELTRADAHAWVEVHFEAAGWVRFDPTPPDLRLRAELDGSLWSRVTELGSAVELWWFQRVVDFDSADQIGALRGFWMRWRGDGREASEPGRQSGSSGSDRPRLAPIPGLDARGTLALLAVAGALLMVWRMRRPAATSAVPVAYRRALQLLARRGWKRAPTQTARNFADAVGTQVPEAVAEAFREITESYLAQRFGDAPEADHAEALARLGELRASRPAAGR